MLRSNSSNYSLMQAYFKRILCFFRKRVVLSLIFLFSLAYFLLQFNALNLIRVSHQLIALIIYCESCVCLQNRRFQDNELEETSYKRDTPLIWRSLKEFNLTDSEICKNSIQGINLIVDERGFLCSRDDLKSTGCCNIQAENTHIYYCESCDKETKCCEVFEHCVSCCLNPDNVRQLINDVVSTLSFSCCFRCLCWKNS